MRQNITLTSTRLNVIWLLYTWYYILLFLTITSESFKGGTEPHVFFIFNLPANLYMNTISVVLAIGAVVISHAAAQRDSKYWSAVNILIYSLMLTWIFVGSIWILRWIN